MTYNYKVKCWKRAADLPSDVTTEYEFNALDQVIGAPLEFVTLDWDTNLTGEPLSEFKNALQEFLYSYALEQSKSQAV